MASIEKTKHLNEMKKLGLNRATFFTAMALGGNFFYRYKVIRNNYFRSPAYFDIACSEE